MDDFARKKGLQNAFSGKLHGSAQSLLFPSFLWQSSPRDRIHIWRSHVD
jgi:hypothetical protein